MFILRKYFWHSFGNINLEFRQKALQVRGLQHYQLATEGRRKNDTEYLTSSVTHVQWYEVKCLRDQKVSSRLLTNSEPVTAKFETKAFRAIYLSSMTEGQQFPSSLVVQQSQHWYSSCKPGVLDLISSDCQLFSFASYHTR